MSGWQPVETAPKDGTRIIAYSPLNGVWMVSWEGTVWRMVGGYATWNETANFRDVTHWMPLPKAPVMEVLI